MFIVIESTFAIIFSDYILVTNERSIAVAYFEHIGHSWDTRSKSKSRFWKQYRLLFSKHTTHSAHRCVIFFAGKPFTSSQLPISKQCLRSNNTHSKSLHIIEKCSINVFVSPVVFNVYAVFFQNGVCSINNVTNVPDFDHDQVHITLGVCRRLANS